MLNRAVVRQGKPYPPANVDELEILPDAAAALARLAEQDYLLLVATNQPDVAKGSQQRAEVERLNDAIGQALPIDEFFVCYHQDADACACRKPKPGLLLEAARKYEIDLGQSFMIGDRWRDVDAGAAAGCLSIWIDRGYAERGPTHEPAARVQSLAEAAEWIIARARPATLRS